MTETASNTTTTDRRPAPTGYVVLKKGAVAGNEVGWQIVAENVVAASASAAVRKHAEKADQGVTALVLVAVPAKSWKPQKITAKTTTTLIVEEAK